MKKDYDLLGVLGRGSFGVVYKARRKETNQLCVVKVIQVSQLDQPSQEDSLNEVKILSSLDNLYIVKYFDSFVEDNQLFIVMEYCEKGDLSLLIKSRTKPLPENRIWEILLQICMGLEYLHRVKVLHRDIKTMNLFMADEKGIRIGDLGIARVLSSTTTFAHTVVGTPYYLSPELCEEKPYNNKSDVWALGCVLYELCALKKPFDATNPGALILKILRSSVPPLSNNWSGELRELVKICLFKDQKKRPDISSILKRPGIKERVLAANLMIPENSVLNAARISMRKSVDEGEEEKRKKIDEGRKSEDIKKKPEEKKPEEKKPEEKKPVIKPRVRKGAPLESKKPSSYARNMLKKPVLPKKLEDPKPSIVPVALPRHLTPAEEEESLIEDSTYEIVAMAAPPVPELTFTTVKPNIITNDSSSDDQSYHSDDKDLYAIKEVDSKLEHTNKDLQLKLVHVQNQQRDIEKIIFHKSDEIIEKIGLVSFNEIHDYFKRKYLVWSS
jgi:NIMA (never in mitosis gene a)-related kinase